MIVKHLEDVPAMKAGDATHLRELLHPKNGDPSAPYSLAHATLEPGMASLPHILKESSEVYVIEEGHGTAYIDGQEVELRPGLVVQIPAGVEQFVRNEGTGPLRFWCIVSPPWNREQEVVREK